MIPFKIFSIISGTALMVVGTVLTLPASAATFTFSDSTFKNEDWSLAMIGTGNGGAVTASQVSAGGNPGEFRQIVNSVNNALSGSTSSILGIHVFNGGTYNPQEQGAIESVNYSENARVWGTWGDGQAGGIALEQNGAFYISGYFTMPETAWTGKLLTNLRQNDFYIAGNPNQHPDFSELGSEIKWGFYRSNSTCVSCNGYSVTGGIDNWLVSVNTSESNESGSACVPEPTTMAGLAIAGYGLLAARRRQKSTGQS